MAPKPQTGGNPGIYMLNAPDALPSQMNIKTPSFIKNLPVMKEHEARKTERRRSSIADYEEKLDAREERLEEQVRDERTENGNEVQEDLQRVQGERIAWERMTEEQKGDWVARKRSEERFRREKGF